MNRPALRYHGGKWKLAKWVISHFPAHRIYTEAYGGAASVLLQKPRCYSEVYNDLDGEVVNLFRVLRDPAQAKDLTNVLFLTPFAREEFEDAYRVCADPIESARRLVVRSFMGFGSGATARGHRTGFRANSSRSGTTPAHDWANYPAALRDITERLSGVVLEHRPALQVLKSHDAPDTLHYVDPPYPVGTRQLRPGESVYNHEMTDADHIELLGALQMLRGMVALSTYANPEYARLLDVGWKSVTKEVQIDHAKRRTEVLYLNPALLTRLPANLFQEAVHAL